KSRWVDYGHPGTKNCKYDGRSCANCIEQRRLLAVWHPNPQYSGRDKKRDGRKNHYDRQHELWQNRQDILALTTKLGQQRCGVDHPRIIRLSDNLELSFADRPAEPMRRRVVLEL